MQRHIFICFFASLVKYRDLLALLSLVTFCYSTLCPLGGALVTLKL